MTEIGPYIPAGRAAAPAVQRSAADRLGSRKQASQLPDDLDSIPPPGHSRPMVSPADKICPS